MTRFNITLTEALGLIFAGLKKAKGAEIFVPKLKAYKVSDLAEAVIDVTGKDVKVRYSSIRPGEKMHETLINESEAAYTVESGDTYLLLAPETYEKQRKSYPSVRINPIQGNYSSDTVPLISKTELKKIIRREIFDESNPFRPDPNLASGLVSAIEARKTN
jgi:FlaA1/EpsC-like NDP-sugar epimerase